MFGKPEWFQKKNVPWGLRPVCWRGWLYAIVWAGVICVPFVALLVSGKAVESVIWVVAMMFFMLWDVQQTRRGLDVPMAELGEPDTGSDEDDDVLIIDEDTEPAHFATRSFDFQVRR